MKNITKKDAEKYTLLIAEELHNKKADSILIIDVTEQTAITDYFVICDSNSLLQLRVLAEYVQKLMAKEKQKPINKCQLSNDSPWLLLDYGYVVVNLFLKEIRAYYNLEKFWNEGNVIYKSNSTSTAYNIDVREPKYLSV